MVRSNKSCVTSSLFWSSLSWSDLTSPVLQAPRTRLSYHGSSNKSCVTSSSYSAILSWLSLLQFCVASSLLWPLLVYPIMVSSNKSCVASSSYSAILSWSVLSSPVLQAPCSEQPFLSSSIRSYHGQFYQVLCLEQSYRGLLAPFLTSSVIQAPCFEQLILPSSRTSYNQPSSWLVVTSPVFRATHLVLSYQILTSPVMQAPRYGQFYQVLCYKLPVSSNLSWSVLSSPVLQAPCSEQPFLSSSIRS